jgi:hypothetical protein
MLHMRWDERQIMTHVRIICSGAPFFVTGIYKKNWDLTLVLRWVSGSIIRAHRLVYGGSQHLWNVDQIYQTTRCNSTEDSHTEFYNLYSAANIVRMTKSRMTEIRNTYRIFVMNLEGRGYMSDVGENLILKRKAVHVRTVKLIPLFFFGPWSFAFVLSLSWIS